MSFNHGIIELSTRRPVTISMFTVALVVFGFVLLGRLGLTLLPDLSYPTLTVRTEYPGAAPLELENLISKPIEEAVGVVKNLRQVRSISRAGQSDVLLEFNWGTDMGLAGLDVREKLDIVQLPLDVKRPSLLRFNPTLAPILRLSLSKSKESQTESQILDEETLIQLRRFSEEEIKRQIESVEGVAAVKISGGLEDEIQVLVDQAKLAQLNLSIEQVANKLRVENVNLSGGRLEEGSQQYLVRTINQYQSVSEIANSIIATVNSSPVYLKDIATVEQKYKEREAITRLNGKEAVEIAIYKEGDANTVSVARALKRKFASIKKNMPEEVVLDEIYNQANFIEQAIDEVINNAMIGGVLAMIVLYLFLRDFRSTLIISLSIPISVIVSFNMMFGFDITMNIMSLGGLALAVGLLVDNAIVVLENIARKREEGHHQVEAARQGAKEVSGAILASTLTTIAVFLPLVFVDGIAGQLFSDQALTVTFALLVSLLVALTFIPMVSAIQGIKESDHNSASEKQIDNEQSIEKVISISIWGRMLNFVTHTIFNTLTGVIQLVAHAIGRLLFWLFQILVIPFNWFYSGLERLYKSILNAALNAKLLVVTVALALFGSSLLLIDKIGIELIPQMSQGEFIVEIEAMPGTKLANTDEIVKRAQKLAESIPEIARSYSVSGSGNRLDSTPDKGGENHAELNIVLNPGVVGEQESTTINLLRDKLKEIPDIKVKIDRPALFTFKTPLEVELVGFNLEKLKSVSDQLQQKISASERFSDVKSTVEVGHPEIQVRFDQEKASYLGLSVPDVAEQLVKQLRGEIATKYAFRDRKIDVLVRVSEDQRSSIEDVRNLIINTTGEKSIPLHSIADVRIETGPSEIHRVNQERVAIVSANLTYGDLGEAVVELQSIIDEIPNYAGIEIRVAGQNEEMESSFDSLKIALALAIFLVYLVMASQFESLLHPFVILFSVPLALVGAVFALYLTNTTLSVVVFIGLIMLSGIVVNNAIVLIDKINQLRLQNIEKVEAVKLAGEARLRPIIMTTLTTALGMLPLALGIGEGAEIRAPMAITVIGGLLLSTLLTLVVIPVLYCLMDRSTEYHHGISTDEAMEKE